MRIIQPPLLAWRRTGDKNSDSCDPFGDPDTPALEALGLDLSQGLLDASTRPAKSASDRSQSRSVLFHQIDDRETGNSR